MLGSEALVREALATEALATEALATEVLATEALATEALATKALATEALATERGTGHRVAIAELEERHSVQVAQGQQVQPGFLLRRIRATTTVNARSTKTF
jgi:hypothetical protein